MKNIRKSHAIWAAAVSALILAGCGNVYSRDDFVSSVMGKSENEVVEKVGKPASIDAVDPGYPKWIYRRETFDMANRNNIDSKTIVIFERKGRS